MSKEKILSVFIDESGDFGQFDPKHPMYYVAMVMHKQANDISANLNRKSNQERRRIYALGCFFTCSYI